MIFWILSNLKPGSSWDWGEGLQSGVVGRCIFTRQNWTVCKDDKIESYHIKINTGVLQLFQTLSPFMSHESWRLSIHYLYCLIHCSAVTGWSKLATLGWGSPFKVKLSWHVCQALNNNLNWLQLLSIQILKYDFEHVSLYCIPLKLSCLHSLLFSLQVSCLYSLHSPLQMSQYKY